MKQRMHNIELLRIVSMLLVILTHFWGHGIDLIAIEPFTFAYYVGWLFKGMSLVSVNLYVLISAFFLCESKFSLKKLVLICLEVEFYSITLYFISLSMKWTVFSPLGCIKAMLPIMSSEYWFATAYVGLLLLTPMLNFTIKHMNRRQHEFSIIILSLLFSVLPNMFFYSRWLNFGEGTGIVWLCVLYFVGSYIRRYIYGKKQHKAVVNVLSIIALGLPFLSRIAIAWGTKTLLGHVVGAGLFFSFNSVIIYPASVLIFIAFLNMRIPQSLGRIINWVASAAFGVFLIHDNTYLSTVMWSVVRSRIHLEQISLIWECMFSVIIIFVGCMLIDKVRELFFRPIRRIPFGNKVDMLINNTFEQGKN